MLTQNATKTDNIATLNSLPNDVGGLTAAQFQYLFDKFGIDFKAYFNDVHLTEINSLLATKAEILGITLGAVPDGSLTAAKLSTTLNDLIASKAKYTDFAKLLSTNGWRKLPDGTIEQWGLINDIPNAGNYTPSYPIAFPNIVFNIQGSWIAYDQYTNTQRMNAYVEPLTLSSFHFRCADVDTLITTRKLHWRAIGN